MIQRLFLRLAGALGVKADLVSQGLMAFAIKVVSVGLSFLMFVALARATDEAGFGIIGTAMSVAAFAAALGSIGQRSNVMRFVAAYDEQGQVAEREAVMRFSYSVATAGTAIAAVGASTLLLVLGHIPNSVAVIAGVGLLTLALGMAEFHSKLLRPLASVSLTLVPKDVLWRILIIVSAGALALGIGSIDASVGQLLWYMSLSLMVFAGLQMWVFSRRRPDMWTGSRSTAALRQHWWAQSLGPWAALTITTAAPTAAVVLVGALIAIEDVGPFFASLRIAQLLTLLMHATEVVLSPQLSRSLTNESTSELAHLCRFGSIVGGGFALVGTLGLAVAGPWLLDIFQDGFSDAHAALVILSLGYLVNCAAGPTAPLLLMSGRGSDLARFQLIARALMLVAMPVAIYAFGTIGAAVCVAASEVIWNVAASRHIRRSIGVEPTILSWLVQPIGRS